MRRSIVRDATLVAIIASAVGGCKDTCFGVVGCGDSPRIAVEGRLVETESGVETAGTLTLIATDAGSSDQTVTKTDSRGLFSLELPLKASAPKISLRVDLPGKPGYTLSLDDCQPVKRWGDACVLNPIVDKPSFPTFQFVYRGDRERLVTNVHVTFIRTGGSNFFGPRAAQLVENTTDAGGIAFLFPPGIYSTGLDPVVGDLIVDLPSPVGTTVRHNYRIPANARFNSRLFAVQETGPGLAYVMSFSDSSTGKASRGVAVAFQRRTGIPTDADSFRVVTDTTGVVRFALRPLAQGTLTGDFSVTPPGSLIATPINGVSLTTFDADSTIVLSRWKVGATGLLYPIPPN